MAKFRADIAAKVPKNNNFHPNHPFAATSIAINIKGKENTECLNITNSEKSANFFLILFTIHYSLFTDYGCGIFNLELSDHAISVTKIAITYPLVMTPYALSK